MTLPEVYAPTVNESETITDAQRTIGERAVPDTRGNPHQGCPANAWTPFECPGPSQ